MERLSATAVGLLVALAPALQPATAEEKGPERFIAAVGQFADNVLAHGRDVYGPVHTPLFVDGVNVDTHTPAVYIRKGQTWIISNGASQQNLFRTLVGLSALTGDQKYRQAAAEAMGYTFANLRSPNGLIHWGGHTIYDAGADRIVGEGYRHELKYHMPFYEFMWQIDPAATKQYIEAFWGAHILDWSNLDMNRHGDYRRTNRKGWANQYKGGPIFFEGKGLTFLSTGTDLIYAASMLAKFTNDQAPLVWATRLAYRYVETRNPATGMGGKQYNRDRRGDRAYLQFAQDLPGHVVYEGTLDVPRAILSITGRSAIVRLKLSEMLGPAGSRFEKWAIEDLKAFRKWAFDEAECKWIPMLTDGTSLEGFQMRRKGYYRPEHNHFQAHRVPSIAFWTHALAWRLSGDAEMWQMARTIGQHHGIGDIGPAPGAKPNLNIKKCGSRNANMLFGLLELYAKTDNNDYLKLAERIGDNIVAQCLHKGFFLPSKNHIYARFDAVEPLALLHLAGAMQGRRKEVPDYWAGRSYFHCPYEGVGRTYDTSVIYTKTRPDK